MATIVFDLLLKGYRVSCCKTIGALHLSANLLGNAYRRGSDRVSYCKIDQTPQFSDGEERYRVSCCKIFSARISFALFLSVALDSVGVSGTISSPIACSAIWRRPVI